MHLHLWQDKFYGHLFRVAQAIVVVNAVNIAGHIINKPCVVIDEAFGHLFIFKVVEQLLVGRRISFQVNADVNAVVALHRQLSLFVAFHISSHAHAEGNAVMPCNVDGSVERSLEARCGRKGSDVLWLRPHVAQHKVYRYLFARGSKLDAVARYHWGSAVSARQSEVGCKARGRDDGQIYDVSA